MVVISLLSSEVLDAVPDNALTLALAHGGESCDELKEIAASISLSALRRLRRAAVPRAPHGLSWHREA